MDGVASKTLSKELKNLEMNQLVNRTQNNTMPVSVNYEITTFGKSLHYIFDAMGEWATKYRNQIVNDDNI
ncbi:MAG: winged helix-turn-helix transcriptional regulator [Sphingobacterium sp.]|nr:winged helix-turn-helix transcriptional regulator [Sphingobacterium sp.]